MFLNIVQYMYNYYTCISTWISDFYNAINSTQLKCSSWYHPLKRTDNFKVNPVSPIESSLAQISLVLF